MLNRVILQGRIPFDLEIKNGDDDKKAFLNVPVSVKRNYKKEGEEYASDDLIYCKAFGSTAQFINKYFAKGSHILIEGELRRDDDYQDKDGNQVKGQVSVYINNNNGVYFQNGNARSENGNGTTEKAKPVATVKVAANAAAPRTFNPKKNSIGI